MPEDTQPNEASGENNGPLLGIEDDGSPPPTRFADAASANSWAESHFEADLWAEYDRALIEEICSGAPPMNQADLRANGSGNSFNINFGRAAAKIESSLSAYHEIADGEELIIQCEIDHPGTPQQRSEWARIWAKEYTRMNRYEWDDYIPRMQMLANMFIRTGVGIAFRGDDWNWQWDCTRLGDFQVSRRDGASVSDFECAVLRRRETPPDVYKWISNREIAEQAGWNVDAVIEALKNASTAINQDAGWDYEQWQRDLKDNGLFLEQGKDPRVELRHFWVKEFDGTVSHYITSPSNDEDFLFVRKGRWDSTCDTITAFLYGVGSNDFYSIRGLGYKIFSIEQMFNILMSRLGDTTLRSLSYLWQPQSADSAQDANQIIWGPDTIIPQGIAPVNYQTPNIGTNILPMLNLLGNIEDFNTGTYTPGQQLLPGGRPDRKSATEAQIEATQAAVLTTSAKVLFMQALDRLHRMTTKAIARKDYPRTMPGGELRWKMLRRCMDQGMPEEAFYAVSCVRATRPIGMGSPAEQMQKLAAAESLMPYLDKAGQMLIQRKKAVNLLGTEYADLIPLEPVIPPDKKVAELEAPMFVNGMIPEITPQEDLESHLAEHAQFVGSSFQALQSGQLAPDQFVTRMEAALPHMQQELQLLSQVPGKQAIVKQITPVLDKMVKDYEQFAQQYAQQQQQEQEAQAQEQEAMSAEQMEQQRKDMVAQAEVQRKQMIAESEIEIDQTKAEADINNQNMLVQTQVENSLDKTTSDIVSKTRKTSADVISKDITTASNIRNASKEKPQGS